MERDEWVHPCQISHALQITTTQKQSSTTGSEVIQSDLGWIQMLSLDPVLLKYSQNALVYVLYVWGILLEGWGWGLES